MRQHEAFQSYIHNIVCIQKINLINTTIGDNHLNKQY